MLVFYSLIIKRQSVLSVKLLLSVSFALLMIFVFLLQQNSVLFFKKKYCCYNYGRSLCGLPAEAREEKNFLAPSLSMIIGLPVTKSIETLASSSLSRN